MKPKSVKCLRNFRKSFFPNIKILKNKILNTNTMTKIKEFNSQICTTREQSQHLLALGLKPETADMYYSEGSMDAEGDIEYHLNIKRYWISLPPNHIPAWSLHRLFEIICDKECEEHYYFDFSIDYDSMVDVYDSIIEVIERHIKNKFFNKEYLKQ